MIIRLTRMLARLCTSSVPSNKITLLVLRIRITSNSEKTLLVLVATEARPEMGMKGKCAANLASISMLGTIVPVC